MYKPKCLVEATWPLTLANLFLGMGSFHLCTTKTRRIIFLVYSAVCVASYTVLLKTTIIMIDTFYLGKSTELGDVVFMALFYGNSVLTICLIAIGWLKRKSLQGIIERIQAYDKALEKIGVAENYRAIFYHQVYFFAGFVLVMLGFTVSNYFTMYDDFVPFAVRIQFLLVIQYPVLVMSVTDITFCFWVRYTRLKFKQLNDLIRGMLTTSPRSPQHKRVLAMKYDLISKDFASLRERITRSADNVETMKTAKQIHLELVKSARSTNEAYGVQILLMMTASFVLITGFLYNAYTIYTANLPTRKAAMEMVPIVSWVVYYALKIFVVNHACARTSTEATNTGDIICELYEPSTSREFRAEIRDFTLQLIQNPLTFTACGFFDLDHTFIQGVIGSITTYLVILIQVGEIPQPEEANFNETTTTALTTVA